MLSVSTSFSWEDQIVDLRPGTQRRPTLRSPSYHRTSHALASSDTRQTAVHSTHRIIASQS
jgi:hypothetical protein